MKVGFFAGSFDPPTLGHLDLFERAHALCDRLVIAIGRHAEKKCLFSKEERIKMVKTITAHFKQIEVISFEDLTIEAAAKHRASCLFRGLRSANSFAYEQEMATANWKLGHLETCFLFTRPELSEISASLVRELAGYGKRLHDFVPEAIEEEVFKRLSTPSFSICSRGLRD